jgi:predicted DNA-binding protein (UPF0251 family)
MDRNNLTPRRIKKLVRNGEANLNECAALLLLQEGQATVSECAKLRGISRQAMWNATSFDARHRRELYLRTVWTKLIDQLTS